MSAIRTGALQPDCRLPSSRLLAKVLNVSRGTVVDAYETLLTTGELVAIAGSGMRVASASPNVPNFSNLKRTAIAAHYPTRMIRFDDSDGTSLYLNVVSECRLLRVDTVPGDRSGLPSTLSDPHFAFGCVEAPRLRQRGLREQRRALMRRSF